jgi:predicted DNA-binding protein with PD1-like motif
MAGQVDSRIITEKLSRKILTLIFDEGDDVVAGIRKTMQDKNIRECRVDDVSGVLAEAIINTFEGNCYKKLDLKNKEVLRASGTFKFTGGDLWGTLHVFTEGRKPISGSVTSAKAAEGFTLKLSFVP